MEIESNGGELYLCGTCHGLYETEGSAPPQRCRCTKDPDEPRWDGFDFNERVHLCECCRIELLPSGSRWSVWFCQECKTRATSCNDDWRRWLIPIGRHTLMAKDYGRDGASDTPISLAGKEVTDPDTARRDQAIDRFATGMSGLFGNVHRLHRWSAFRLAAILDQLGMAGSDVLADDYLTALRALAQTDPSFDKPAAFHDLSGYVLRAAAGR